jgi:hypothetical protein
VHELCMKTDQGCRASLHLTDRQTDRQSPDKQADPDRQTADSSCSISQRRRLSVCLSSAHEPDPSAAVMPSCRHSFPHLVCVGGRNGGEPLAVVGRLADLGGAVLEVVDRENHARLPEAIGVVAVPVCARDGGGAPVVAVQNVRLALRLQQELQRRLQAACPNRDKMSYSACQIGPALPYWFW